MGARSAAAAPALASDLPHKTSPAPVKVERWEVFETTLNGPATGNPYVDVKLTATFRKGNRAIRVRWVLRRRRKVPHPLYARRARRWTFTTESSVPALGNRSGAFDCTPASRTTTARSASATPSTSPTPTARRTTQFGTTCYAWTHQGDELRRTDAAHAADRAVQQAAHVHLPQALRVQPRTSRRCTRSTARRRTSGTTPGSTPRSSATSSSASASSATWASRPT